MINSPLSEYAVLSFEYGYSVAASRTLTIWEAQFGDFANVAQAVLDQFISSGAEKWEQRSGSSFYCTWIRGPGAGTLVGKNGENAAACGQGQSSQRPSHDPCKPPIIFTPKKLLRLKAATSPPEEIRHGKFHRVIVQTGPLVRRVILCSGKIFYDLAEGLANDPRKDVMLMRLEQLYPFPADEVATALRAAPRADLVWVQEEPANYGIWTWLHAHLEQAIADVGIEGGPLRRISRPESASPAGSFHARHENDQAHLVAQALGTS